MFFTLFVGPSPRDESALQKVARLGCDPGRADPHDSLGKQCGKIEQDVIVIYMLVNGLPPGLGRLSTVLHRSRVPMCWPSCACQNKTRASVTHNTRSHQTRQPRGRYERRCSVSGDGFPAQTPPRERRKKLAGDALGTMERPERAREASTRGRAAYPLLGQQHRARPDGGKGSGVEKSKVRSG